jgi:hypothetical protein
MTAFGSLESAIDAMRQGAYDYLTKPFKLPELSLVVKRAVEDQQLREENRRLPAEVERRYSFDNILGRSKAMQSVFEQIRVVADTDAPVLSWRQRIGQGTGGPGHSLAQRPPRRPLRRRQLRCHPRDAPGIRSSSVTSAERSRGPTASAGACSSRLRAAPSSSTRSPKCRSRSR